MTMRIQRRSRAAALRLWGSLVLLTLAGGCVSFPKKTVNTSGKTGSIRRDTNVPLGKIHPNVLAAEVARFADEVTALVSQAADSFAAQVETPQARATALYWKTGAANSSMIIATGSNPTANLLDMVVWVSLQRIAFEEYWLPKYGKPVEPILTVTRDLEGEIWDVAKRVLTAPQQKELRELIQEWREKHPEQIYISVQFRDFAEIAAKDTSGLNAKPGSLFSLAFLDPFSGLDPTTRELAQTRFFAERALYIMERMPKLLRWQSELVIAQTLVAPEVQQLVSNSTQFAQSAQQLTQAVQKFPEQVAVEREQIMKELSRQAPEWQALSAQFQQTFHAGSEMAGSVDAAVKSLDAFIQRVAPPAPAPSAAGVTDTNLVATAGAAAGKHFDVTEYGAAAAEIAKAAQQLDTLTHSLEKTTPEINAVVEHTGLQGKELVDYAYRKAMWFLGLVLIGVLVAMLTYRWFASRLCRPLVPNSADKR
jgi:hypothetical protein